MQSKESIGKDATSKKTLEDLQEDEAPVTDTSDDLPSPDGEFGGADKAKDADPV